MNITELIQELQKQMNEISCKIVHATNEFQFLARDTDKTYEDFPKVNDALLEATKLYDELLPALIFINENAQFSKEAAKGVMKIKKALEKRKKS